MTFHDWLKATREARGLTQADLLREVRALGAQVSRQAISAWESGRSRPSRANRDRLFVALEVADRRAVVSAMYGEGEFPEVGG